MNAILKFSVALALVALLGIAAWRIAAMPGSAASARDRLSQETLDALGVEAASWASVEMDGQKAILSGEAPTPKIRDALIARIAAAEWSGGLLAGGVTAVDASGLTVAPVMVRADPFVFIAEHEGGALSFSGHTPDQATRDRLYQLAASLFPGSEISGGLDVAEGAPVSSADWSAAATSLLRALSHLRHGVAEADGATFSITGEAEDDRRANAARSLLAGLPDGLAGKADIDIRKAPASIGEIISQTNETKAVPPAAREPGETEIATATSEQAEPQPPAPDECLTQLQTLIASRKISFRSARADIDNPSRDHLRRISTALLQCPSARLLITGHTDSSGSAARNRQLSGYRADAVRAFLVSVGAPSQQLSARGAGSAQPLASNATAAGREQNRRIEIEAVISN